MIELFDAARLLPRKDHTLAAAGLLLAVAASGLAVYGVLLQQQWRQLDGERQALAARLQRSTPAAAPGSALLADLRMQTEAVEAEVAAISGGPASATPLLTPSQWLARLDQLGSNDVSLSRAEIDRAGAARIDGQARTPQALGQYVQAWEHQDRLAALPARTIDVKQDADAAPLLRFQLRAMASPAAAPGAAR